MRRDEGWGYYRYDMRFDPFFALKVVSFLFFYITLIDRELPTLEDLGVTLTNIEDQAPWELRPYRAHNYYDESLGEFEKPAPPPVIG